MHLKKGFSKQVSFKASQSSTSYPLVKTGINVLCRKKIYISRQLCSFATVLLLESHPWRSTGQCVSESSSTAAARTFLLTQLQSYLLLFFSVLSWCYCFYLLLKNYSLIIFQSACLLFFFQFRLYNKRIKYLKSLACYFIKCICRRMGIVTVWLSRSIEASNCLVLNSLYLKYAAYFFIYFV